MRRCCWATSMFTASLDLSSWFQASVIVLFFLLICQFTFFCSARSFGACIGVDSNTHRHALDVHNAGNWKQIDKYCEKKMLLHQQIIHNIHTTPTSPCISPHDAGSMCRPSATRHLPFADLEKQNMVETWPYVNIFILLPGIITATHCSFTQITEQTKDQLSV